MFPLAVWIVWGPVWPSCPRPQNADAHEHACAVQAIVQEIPVDEAFMLLLAASVSGDADAIL